MKWPRRLKWLLSLSSSRAPNNELLQAVRCPRPPAAPLGELQPLLARFEGSEITGAHDMGRFDARRSLQLARAVRVGDDDQYFFGYHLSEAFAIGYLDGRNVNELT